MAAAGSVGDAYDVALMRGSSRRTSDESPAASTPGWGRRHARCGDDTHYDVAIVIGANDVVNPVARTDPDSPIAGMPIIDVDKCRTVIVIKRSLSPGFAGIPNPLFAADNTLMLFGDGQEAVLEITTAMKDN